ncbi:MAG: class I SAM-dependent methyltransferase [Actinobacteria bacterium]|nr:class I SAM-dependent methyltransferase [Actinomycetota bacterium]
MDESGAGCMKGQREEREALIGEVLALATAHEAATGEPLVHLNTVRGVSRFVEDALLIRDHLPAAASVADVGCGDGQMAYVLHRLGLKVVAADIGPKAPLFVRSIPGNEDLGVVPYLTLKEGEWPAHLERKFDGVCLSGVLEHVPDFGEFVRQTRSLLEPNGMLFIFFFPNRLSWIEWVHDRRLGTATHHPIRFTPRELSLLLRWYGFKVKAVDYEEILPVNLTQLPTRLREPLRQCQPLLAQASRVLRRTPGIQKISTSFRVVAVNAVNWH